MNRAFSRRIRVLGVLAFCGLALGACGRRGDLEPPPGTPPAQTQSRDNQIGKGNSATDGNAAPVRRNNITPPSDPFILDKIL